MTKAVTFLLLFSLLVISQVHSQNVTTEDAKASDAKKDKLDKNDCNFKEIKFEYYDD